MIIFTQLPFLILAILMVAIQKGILVPYLGYFEDTSTNGMGAHPGMRVQLM